MKHAFLMLAVVGAVAPLAAFAPWVIEHGLDIPRLLSEMFATEVSRFFSLDVIISAIVVLLMAGRGARQGVRHVWLAVVGTLCVGVSLGLPLYLYLEAHGAEAGAKS